LRAQKKGRVEREKITQAPTLLEKICLEGKENGLISYRVDRRRGGRSGRETSYQKTGQRSPFVWKPFERKGERRKKETMC